MATGTPDPAPASGVGLYLVNYFNAVQTLEDTRDKYHETAMDALTSERDRAEAIAAALDITDQLAHLKDAHEAFMSEFAVPGVLAPSATAIQKSTDLSAALATVIARANTAVAVLHIVTQFVSDWNTLSETASPAAPAPAPGALAQAPTPAAAVPTTALNMSFLKTHG